MMMKVPDSVVNQLNELNELMDKDVDKKVLSATDAAKVLGIDVETLKYTARSGGCPFALSGKRDSRSQLITKIPKLPFYLFMTQMNGIELLEENEL